MSTQRIAGVILLVAGVVLFVVGMNASDSLADRWSNFFTGHFTDTTVWYMVGGVAAAVVGLILLGTGGRVGTR
jgi:drug/metabolite transporter (DMT)-like permease